MKSLITIYFAVHTWWLAGALPYVMTRDGAQEFGRQMARRLFRGPNF
jgi:hypothetical protein